MNRRDFIRRGSLWVAGATVVAEPIIKRLWAFPTNPLGGTRIISEGGYQTLCRTPDADIWVREFMWVADFWGVDGVGVSNAFFEPYWKDGGWALRVAR